MKKSHLITIADIIQRHRSRIIMLCRAYTSNPDELEDCFQDVALRLIEGFPSFRGEASEATWIYRVTLNTAINFQAASRRRRKLSIPLLDHDAILASDQHDDGASRRLYALIGRLDHLERALVLLWLESLPYDEIALIMGLSVKNVSVRLSRIRAKLKAMATNCHDSQQ